MRDFLDAILEFIGAASLSDDEFNSLTIESAGYDQETYDALFDILKARDSISAMLDRLGAYFKAKGVSLTEGSSGQSQIYIGSVL